MTVSSLESRAGPYVGDGKKTHKECLSIAAKMVLEDPRKGFFV